MNSYCIRQKRVNRLQLLESFDKEIIQIGVPVTNDEANGIGLMNTGDSLLPSQSYGPACRKNADGFTWSDKTKEKEYRYVSTIWSKPFGNVHAAEQAIDIYRNCYPKVVVEPTEIELLLQEDIKKNKYIIAYLTDDIRENHLKETINIFLEIFGFCYIYRDNIETPDRESILKRNWEFLRPDELESKIIRGNISDATQEFNSYDKKRLEVLNSYSYNRIAEGIKGYRGYYAFVFDKYCVFESMKYGNATYIVESKDWESLSQLTKRELFELSAVEERVIHNKQWEENLKEIFKRRGIK